MATNMYLKLGAIKGESSDNKHKDWIEVMSWSHGFSQPTSPVRASQGGTVEKANHSALSCSKYLDVATDDILKHLWSGKQIDKSTLECFRSDGDNEPTKYLMVEMEKVVISDYSISSGGMDHPMENISMAYGKVKYTYIDQKKADGTGGGAQPISHDLTLNKVE